uniref:Uncharacterized protein n=1 Tax=Oryza barthii TaxID=65489 RepID=A0A0D3FEJ8_9ORYZ
MAGGVLGNQVSTSLTTRTVLYRLRKLLMPLDTTTPATESPSTAAKQCSPDSGHSPVVRRRRIVAIARLLLCSFHQQPRVVSNPRTYTSVRVIELKEAAGVDLPGRRRRVHHPPLLVSARSMAASSLLRT